MKNIIHLVYATNIINSEGHNNILKVKKKDVHI